ncbi:MAG: GNAT family N-acetyltransferase [Bauldia sp.]|uniref:GNAT family N-acetyltransferase n=1 Tax=Bauldia sp. TaxID=2575872 RepID=UPI001E03DA17|nr:N-acetyltransferase [Bauldia sp.]MCB1497085.1 GNAT family N-acetyltransferase [Bauldia sp.]
MSTPSIRPATLRDATHLAALVDIAGEGLATYFWGQMADVGQSPFEVGRIRARRDQGAFTWRNAHVAEIGGEVAGALVGYRIADDAADEDLSETSEIVRPLAELEALAPGRWYVNVLAVFPEFRGNGLGTLLLRKADEVGRRDAPAGMAIIVASENQGALRLYEKVGYRTIARRAVFPYPGNRRGGDWVLLTKPHS